MYLHARSWGVQPSEFWNMTLSEWWAEYDHHDTTSPGKFAGNLTQEDVNDITAFLDKKAAADGTA
jgi:hypothetical protein